MYIIDHSEEAGQTFSRIQPISTFVSSHHSPCPEPESDMLKNPVEQTT